MLRAFWTQTAPEPGQAPATLSAVKALRVYVLAAAVPDLVGTMSIPLTVPVAERLAVGVIETSEPAAAKVWVAVRDVTPETAPALIETELMVLEVAAEMTPATVRAPVDGLKESLVDEIFGA